MGDDKIGKFEWMSLSKQELCLLARSAYQSTYIVDGLWFQAVEKLLGTEKAIQLDKEVWSVGGASEAKRLIELTDIPNNLNGLAKALNLHSMYQFTEYEVSSPLENILIFTVTNCRPQNARLRKGLGEFACKEVAIPCMEGFVKGINPRAKAKCLRCPPDPHPEDGWCQWEFTLD